MNVYPKHHFMNQKRYRQPVCTEDHGPIMHAEDYGLEDPTRGEWTLLVRQSHEHDSASGWEENSETKRR